MIREAIRVRGPVSFAWFMEQALYHPEHGYYSPGRAAIGREGDYFTSVSTGPLFGRVLAAQFSEMWETLGRPNDFTIVEQGAHDGQFARDLLGAAQRHHPDFLRALRYEIIEPFRPWQQRQAATLAEFESKVRWRNSLVELPPFRGLHFSNELLDALPVHLLRWTGAEWCERHVTERDGSFAFVDLPLANPELAKRLCNIPMPLPPGYETEVNLAALSWMEQIASKLTAGFVVVADYGYARDEFYAPHRTNGTLRCYAKHRVVASPLSEIGHADITAHVEWTSLMECAEASGLNVAGFTDQHHFITGLLAGALGQEFGPDADPEVHRALQTLLHPGFFGMKFQFLALAKNLDSTTRLSGFRFARQQL
ncbi:MAG: class I SAM-dependent methyltransferase [Chthoniobacterales bacterium]